MFKEKKPIPLPKLDFIDLTDKKQGFIVLATGIIVAIILGVLEITLGAALIQWLLAVGIVVGILNIFHEEGILFLILGLTMTLMLNLLVSLDIFMGWVVTLFNGVIYLLAPATVVVALKVLYALVK